MEKLTRLMNKIKEKKGFTLVELIVVIAIIAILAAVAVPSLTKYIGEAKTSGEKQATEVVRSAAQVAATEVAKTGVNITDENFLTALEAVLPKDNYVIKTDVANSCTVTLKQDTSKSLLIKYTLAADKKSMTITEVTPTGW